VKKDQGNITDDLLVKYLLGETSAAEDAQVQDWVKESRENKDHLDQLRLIWNQSKTLAASAVTPTDEAWEQFKTRLNKPKTIRIPRRSFGWVRVAALVMLLAGAGTLAWIMNHRQTENIAVASKVETNTPPQPMPSAPQVSTPPPAETAANTVHQETVNTTYVAEKGKPGGKKSNNSKQNDAAEIFYNQYRTNDFVCNGTPCPLEICIIQSIKCPGGKPSAVATCSTLMPDQSGQVRYKSADKIAKNCHVTVQQIRIKRVSTGETIVLDEHSQPSTAEEVFSYITGRKKGNILAGMFHADCNNNDYEHTLKLDNNFGNLVLQ
jgi:hypothetical protein